VQIYLLSTTYFCEKIKMRIAVTADDVQWEELTNNTTDINWERIASSNENLPPADAYIILNAPLTASFRNITKPVLLNSVVHTLKEINAPSSVIRFNGWKGFLARDKWEVAGMICDEAAAIFLAMEKQITAVADEPGLVAARPIAMIINEAYFALEQEVGTKTAIDTAMKLGTNYPFGPFEWADSIGLSTIYDLLYILSLTDKRYIPSSLLKREAAV
jgi:3-hydroxybutyryl-CoA dehydrogenase